MKVLKVPSFWHRLIGAAFVFFAVHTGGVIAQTPAASSTATDASVMKNAATPDIESYKTRVQGLAGAGKMESAHSVAVTSLKYFPRDYELFAFYSQIFWDAQQFEHAVFWIEKIHAAMPSDDLRKALATGYYNMGTAKAQARRWKSAGACFSKALANGAPEKETLRALAFCKAWAGDYTSALAVTDRAFAKYPDFKELLKIQEYILVKKRDMNTLEQRLKLYIERNPADIETHLEFNRILQARGKCKAALADLEQLGGQYPQDTAIASALARLRKDAAQPCRKNQGAVSPSLPELFKRQ
jgi:tetratricopeptide (TPR) repeat protein